MQVNADRQRQDGRPRSGSATRPDTRQYVLAHRRQLGADVSSARSVNQSRRLRSRGVSPAVDAEPFARVTSALRQEPRTSPRRVRRAARQCAAPERTVPSALRSSCTRHRFVHGVAHPCARVRARRVDPDLGARQPGWRQSVHARREVRCGRVGEEVLAVRRDRRAEVVTQSNGERRTRRVHDPQLLVAEQDQAARLGNVVGASKRNGADVVLRSGAATRRRRLCIGRFKRRHRRRRCDSRRRGATTVRSRRRGRGRRAALRRRPRSSPQ